MRKEGKGKEKKRKEIGKKSCPPPTNEGATNDALLGVRHVELVPNNRDDPGEGPAVIVVHEGEETEEDQEEDWVPKDPAGETHLLEAGRVVIWAEGGVGVAKGIP